MPKLFSLKDRENYFFVGRDGWRLCVAALGPDVVGLWVVAVPVMCPALSWKVVVSLLPDVRVVAEPIVLPLSSVIVVLADPVALGLWVVAVPVMCPVLSRKVVVS